MLLILQSQQFALKLWISLMLPWGDSLPSTPKTGFIFIPVLPSYVASSTLSHPALVLGHDFSCLNSGQRAVAQLARVAVSKAAGWGFESLEIVSTEEAKGLFGRIAMFYRQVISELSKVVWPTRNQLTTYTAVVLVFVGFVILVVSIFDLILTRITFWIFG